MSEPRTILIADDDPAVVEFLKLAFSSLGYPVEYATDGQVALSKASSDVPPALVMLDALLPKLDGFQVLAELRKRHPDLPVVMMSGIYKKRSYAQEAMDKLGAREYLLKPLSALKIWEVAERYVGEPPQTSTAPPMTTDRFRVNTHRAMTTSLASRYIPPPVSGGSTRPLVMMNPRSSAAASTPLAATARDAPEPLM